MQGTSETPNAAKPAGPEEGVSQQFSLTNLELYRTGSST